MKKDWFKEIDYVMKCTGYPYWRIEVLEPDESPNGEPWVLIDDSWFGYVDETFYNYMEDGTNYLSEEEL